MADERPKNLTRGGRAVAGAAERYLDTFLRMLREDSENHGGVLKIDRIEQVADALRDRGEVMTTYYERANEACVKAHEDGVWEEKRQNVLARLIIQKFAHLLVSDDKIGSKSALLSRKCVPAFADVMETAIGRDAFDAYQGQARAIRLKFIEAYGAESPWEEFFHTQDVRDLVRDFLIDFSRHFDDFERRRTWFIDRMSTHLGHETTGESFEISDFRRVMQALYAEFTGRGKDQSIDPVLYQFLYNVGIRA